MTPDQEIGYAVRVLQNMLDAGEIGAMTVDNEARFRKMLATLRAAQAEVAEMRADRPKRARVSVTGRVRRMG